MGSTWLAMGYYPTNLRGFASRNVFERLTAYLETFAETKLMAHKNDLPIPDPYIRMQRTEVLAPLSNNYMGMV